MESRNLLDERFRTKDITDVEQAELDAKKKELRISNEYYMRAHPEIKDIADYFLRQLLIKNPSNVQKFASGKLPLQSLQKEPMNFN